MPSPALITFDAFIDALGIPQGIKNQIKLQADQQLYTEAIELEAVEHYAKYMRIVRNEAAAAGETMVVAVMDRLLTATSYLKQNRTNLAHDMQGILTDTEPWGWVRNG